MPGPIRCTSDRGATGVQYAALIVLAALLAGTVTVAVDPPRLAARVGEAICRILNMPSGDGCGREAALAPAAPPPGSPAPGPSGGPKPTAADAKYQPHKCLLSDDTTTDSYVVRFGFFKLSGETKVEYQEWSDGTVTLTRTNSAGAGVEGELDLAIPGLDKWGGSASLSGSFSAGGGTGGQWLFNGHHTGNVQRDLTANMADAQQFVKYLKGAEQCANDITRAHGAELSMVCNHANQSNRPLTDPRNLPNVDISKTSTEMAGGVSFTKDFSPGGKKGGGKGGGKAGDAAKPIGKGNDDAATGNVSGQGLSGTMSNDVLVMRAKRGPSAGTITFVYTFDMNGKVGEGYQGEGDHMQEIAVTYDAAAYDREEKAHRPHHPTSLTITTSERASGNPGVDASAGANAGPVSVTVGGGGGKTRTTLHTEVAKLNLTDPKDSTTVENWLRGRGPDPASGTLPSPYRAARPLGLESSPIDRLLHDKAKISSLDYKVNIDWWNASLGIGVGVALGKADLGFNLFGFEVSHQHSKQTLTGDPAYAGAPRPDGHRPWLPFTNCTRAKPA